MSGRAKVAGRSLGNFPEAQFALNYVRLSLPLSSQLSKIMAISIKPKWWTKEPFYHTDFFGRWPSMISSYVIFFLALRMILILGWDHCNVQGSAKRLRPGLVNFVTAVAYHA